MRFTTLNICNNPFGLHQFKVQTKALMTEKELEEFRNHAHTLKVSVFGDYTKNNIVDFEIFFTGKETQWTIQQLSQDKSFCMSYSTSKNSLVGNFFQDMPQQYKLIFLRLAGI